MNNVLFSVAITFFSFAFVFGLGLLLTDSGGGSEAMTVLSLLGLVVSFIGHAMSSKRSNRDED